MQNTLKIYVVSFTGNSGLTDYSVSLCKQLAKQVDVTLITADSYDAASYRATFQAVKIFRRTRQYPIDIFRFVFFMLRNKPDVVLFESWIKYPLIEMWLTKLFNLFGIKTALAVHDLLPHYPKPWSRWVLSRYYRCFHGLIAHSQRTADGLKDMGVTVAPLIVPHGEYDIFKLDEALSCEAARTALGLQTNDFVVLFFGHIETRKGILEFLRASKALRDRPKIKFLVAGGNSLGGEALLEFDAYRAEPNALLHDQKIDFARVQYYFSAANVIAVPYLEGTTSGVVKLAMAFEKPFIATDVGDFAETLQDWSGMLIANTDISLNLARAIERMADLYESYTGDLGKKREKYRWDSIAIKHIEYLLPPI